MLLAMVLLKHDGKNVAYIKFDYCITTFEILSKEIFEDNYDLKYLEEVDDNNKCRR